MKTLKQILLGALALGSVATATPKRAEAQVNGNVEYIQAPKQSDSFMRTNIFYGLPLKMNGYTFTEFYQDGNGYFGKTILNRPIKAGLGSKAEAVHIGEPCSRVGFGAGFSIPGLPKGSWASLGFLPIWISEEGKRAQAQYAFGFSLPQKINLSGFGEMNVAAEGGPQWSYGETELTKKIGPAEIGYNLRMFNDGNASPRLENGIIVTLNWGGSK